MSIQTIIKLVPPPEKPKGLRKNRRWDRVEEKIGNELPADYKIFIETYGSGLFAGFIRIFNPFDSSEYISLLRMSTTVVDIYQDIIKSYGDVGFPFVFFPMEKGLLPCGNDENGNHLFWLTGTDSEKWKIVVLERGAPNWQLFDMGLTDFLANALTKKIRCKIWPSDYPGNRKSFTFECF
ncbi:SMI1/KNR4 family protein [Planctopirus hydrillae]|uniref:Knr4/Smi1-like domain-containing protein n=1 Tax=Planctopirus hydrillae TaxID=1841610 RepID=A0A1C3EU15_9PLAN|nr:SMI1/KNR4 family protein [Planctopirus hydrillae]ODA36603.1 hypothetical protein A6X21_15830 [Planctopirus hydrillae]